MDKDENDAELLCALASQQKSRERDGAGFCLECSWTDPRPKAYLSIKLFVLGFRHLGQGNPFWVPIFDPVPFFRTTSEQLTIFFLVGFLLVSSSAFGFRNVLNNC